MKKIRIYAFLARRWWDAWGERILALLLVLASSMFAYSFGFLRGVSRVQEPMTISVPQQEPVVLSSAQARAQEQKAFYASCAYVASKHGTRYYPPTCKAAARIAEKNLICLASTEEAAQKGYTPSTACSQ